ncbi:MAG: hypothetical protein EOO10_01930 [Chitinophagaceae bacterium]|nr:MAG: hypothetical protein EOO10_01930 [Chitinophagaceae bacterium]
MKQLPVFAKWIAIAILFQAFTYLVPVFEKLGLEEATARNYVVNNVLGNFFNNTAESFVPNDFDLPRAKLLSSVAKGDKAGAAKELCAWLKDYTKSEEFIQTYNQRREALKPRTNNSVRPDEETIAMTRESLKSTEKDLAQMKKIKGVPAASLEVMEDQVAQQRALLKAWDDPFPVLTRWQTNYPANPRDLVRKRLQSYLDIVATVDFDARLTNADQYGIRKFVKPEYEKKDNRWKAIFRAGREVNVVVTAFVKDWMKEMAPAGKEQAATNKPVATKQVATRKQ